jgi:hypothetical protein
MAFCERESFKKCKKNRVSGASRAFQPFENMNFAANPGMGAPRRYRIPVENQFPLPAGDKMESTKNGRWE